MHACMVRTTDRTQRFSQLDPPQNTHMHMRGSSPHATNRCNPTVLMHTHLLLSCCCAPNAAAHALRSCPVSARAARRPLHTAASVVAARVSVLWRCRRSRSRRVRSSTSSLLSSARLRPPRLTFLRVGTPEKNMVVVVVGAAAVGGRAERASCCGVLGGWRGCCCGVGGAVYTSGCPGEGALAVLAWKLRLGRARSLGGCCCCCACCGDRPRPGTPCRSPTYVDNAGVLSTMPRNPWLLLHRF